MAVSWRTLNAHALVIAAAVCGVALNGVTATAGDRDSDAFILAISHFDPQHARGILWRGDEMKFVGEALAVAVKSVPELSAVHVRTSDALGSMGQPLDLISLQVLDPISEFPAFEGDWDYMQNFSDEVLDGCRAEYVTVERGGTNGRWSTDKKSTWWPCGDVNRAEADTSCNATTGAHLLCTAGIRSVRTASYDNGSGHKTGLLFLDFEQPVDLQHEATEIMALPGYEKVFGAARLRPCDPMLFGGGDEIAVVASDDCEGFKGITLLFSHGWDDCPAGCISRHFWKVTIKAQTDPRGIARRFTVTAVEESGTVLSPQMRAGLIAGFRRDW